jgi:uncharacterized membrane protein
VVIGIAYFVIYPRFCRANGNKIAVNDLIATGLVLLVAGSLFWGTGQSFNMIIIKANWFWFTLITYAAIEIPLMIWYFNKHDVWSSFDIPPDK